VATSLHRRVVPAVRRRVDIVRHRGSAVECPLCGGRFDRFKALEPAERAVPALRRPRAIAPSGCCCARPDLLGGIGSLLHFAPEWTMRARLAPLAGERGLRYVTADLDPAGVDLQLDLTALDLPDAAFDAVMCSHVLEHIPDDAAAVRELRRVTAPGGWCLVMVPLDITRETTYEDPSVVSPEGREREFLQHDHVRLYAPDIADRLRAAGFDAEVIHPADLGPQAVERAGMLPADLMFLCR
jgi:SAM-dependent methyltransferase